VLLRMNAPNLVLYDTCGVKDKGDNPLLKRFLFFTLIEGYKKYTFIVLLTYPLFFFRRADFYY
jgi:hypothetical protein